MARAGRRFLLKPGRPLYRRTAPAAASAAALIAASTLTTAVTDTVLPTVSLAAASSLISAVSSVVSVDLVGTATLTATVSSSAVALTAVSTLTANATAVAASSAVALSATSTLTTAAIDTVLPGATLIATSSLTAIAVDITPAAVALTAVSTLTPNAATPVLAVVALSAISTLVIAGTVVVPTVVSLGAVTVAAGPVAALAMVQPGTLANPYAASDSATRSVDFNNALFVATEPVAITGPAAAPSVWFEFTESQVADWLASTSSFINGATIELYSGPPGAGPGDLTFIATDGSSLVTLGAVTLSALVTTVATSLRVQLVDLGAVAVAASPAVAVVLL